MKPVKVESVKHRAIERAISKNVVKPPANSINSDISELKRLRKQKDEARMIPVLENLSRNFYELGDYKKSLDAVNVSLAFREKLGVNDNRARTLEFRGIIHEKLGQKVKALEDLTWAGTLSKNLLESNRAKNEGIGPKLGVGSHPGSLIIIVPFGWQENLEIQKVRSSHFLNWEIFTPRPKISKKLPNIMNYQTLSLMAERSVFYKKLGKFGEARKTMDEALQALKSLDYLLYFSFMNRSEYHDKLSAVQQ